MPFTVPSRVLRTPGSDLRYTSPPAIFGICTLNSGSSCENGHLSGFIGVAARQSRAPCDVFTCVYLLFAVVCWRSRWVCMHPQCEYTFQRACVSWALRSVTCGSLARTNDASCSFACTSRSRYCESARCVCACARSDHWLSRVRTSVGCRAPSLACIAFTCVCLLSVVACQRSQCLCRHP